MGTCWEYAVLEWMRFNVEPAPREGGAGGGANEAHEQTFAVFGVRFSDGAGKSVYRLLHQVTTKNVNDKSKNVALVDFIGLMGRAGWEMVSTYQEPDKMDICTVSSVYFKRAVAKDRAVDEPKVELEFLA